jgi:hypothetical protein
MFNGTVPVYEVKEGCRGFKVWSHIFLCQTLMASVYQSKMCLHCQQEKNTFCCYVGRAPHQDKYDSRLSTSLSVHLMFSNSLWQARFCSTRSVPLELTANVCFRENYQEDIHLNQRFNSTFKWHISSIRCCASTPGHTADEGQTILLIEITIQTLKKHRFSAMNP